VTKLFFLKGLLLGQDRPRCLLAHQKAGFLIKLEICSTHPAASPVYHAIRMAGPDQKACA